jgi:thiol-disulfide isomerase/thioredoxin
VRLVRAVGVVIVAVAVVAGCADASGGRPAAAPTAGSSPGQLQFTGKSVDGADFSGQSLAGKPAVLWFWAPWCPICQGEAPSVGQIAHANTGVRFVGVAAQDQVPAMREYVARYQLGFSSNLADIDASVWRRFGVTVQPAFAFMGADGSVDVVKSALSGPDLARRVGTLSAP